MAAIVAVFFLAIVVTGPLALSKQARASRDYLRQFQAAEREVNVQLERTGKLPVDLGKWATQMNFEYMADTLEVTTDARMCKDGFGMGPNDRYLLRFWRGEWEECYASPSGKNTLLLSTGELLRLGLWKDLALYWLIMLGAAIFAWWIWPRPTGEVS
jgi:hypothetical protein